MVEAVRAGTAADIAAETEMIIPLYRDTSNHKIDQSKRIARDNDKRQWVTTI